MNLKKEALKTLSAFLERHKEQFAEPMPTEPKGYTTKDGTPIMIDKLEVGGKCTMEDGTPCPMGEIYLSDGSTIYVDETGTITNIETAQVETQEPAMEDMKKAVSQFAVGTPEERIARLELVGKALMNSAFGWQMREAEETALRNQAIAAYSQFSEQVNTAKEVFSQKDNEVETLKATVESQGKLLKEMYEVLSNFSNAEQITKTEPYRFEAKKTDISSFIKSQLKK